MIKSELVKTVNGIQVKTFTREFLNQELIKKGEWGIEYCVPGREIYQYFITINKIKFRSPSLKSLTLLCETYTKSQLQKMSEVEINNFLFENK